jgi:hypothetical protein
MISMKMLRIKIEAHQTPNLSVSADHDRRERGSGPVDSDRKAASAIDVVAKKTE